MFTLIAFKKERRVRLAPGVIPGPSSGVRVNLHHVALRKGWTMDKLPDDSIGLYEQYFEFLGIRGGLATAWDFPGFCPIFKDTKGNVVAMYEYLRFPFLAGDSIAKGVAFTNQDRVAQHTTLPLLENQSMPDKTDHQKEVKVEDPKIVATHETKARATAKKRENKKRGREESEGSPELWLLPILLWATIPKESLLLPSYRRIDCFIFPHMTQPITPFITTLVVMM
nr:hypothetical protein [Tanacetum cinerariifolium]